MHKQYKIVKNIENQYALMQDNTKVAEFFINSTPTQKEYPWHFGGKVLECATFIIFENLNTEALQKTFLEYFNIDSLHILELQNENKLAQSTSLRTLGHVYPNAFELRLHKNSPFAAIKMHASFRHGSMTPWGGNKLQTLFNKPIPDKSTGESLEVSVLKGLESKDILGTTLTSLIENYSEAFTGKGYTAGNFPLLLKLLDAKGLLSIQVHPNDHYACTHADGKLGKEEVWLVLDCDENAQLVYGLKENTDEQALQNCLLSGKSPEDLVQFVKVQKGDIFYIPPGTVHALGSGIVVYELQQSSDVTYRMWDWGRTDAQGNARELHIEDSIHCINYKANNNKSTLPTTLGTHRIVSGENFTLYSINLDGAEHFYNTDDTFALCTAFGDLHLHNGDCILHLQSGESAFIPANCKEITVTGKGFAIIGKPKQK